MFCWILGIVILGLLIIFFLRFVFKNYGVLILNLCIGGSLPLGKLNKHFTSLPYSVISTRISLLIGTGICYLYVQLSITVLWNHFDTS